MLKLPDEPEPRPAENDRPVGELVHELIEDGKAYARAELEFARATALAKVRALRAPAIAFAVALALLGAAICALAFGVAAGLSTLVGPLAGGALAFVLFAGLGAIIAWVGARKLRDSL